MSNEFTKVTFTKKDLVKIHRHHLSYLIAGAHACNEINGIRIFHALENFEAFDKEPERSFIAIRQFNIIRNGISKIYEFNNLTSKYLGSIKYIYPKFAEKHRKKYAPIARQINSKKWMHKIRNKFSSHYDLDFAISNLDLIKDYHELYFIFGSEQGETSFLFAEEIMSLPIYYEIGGMDISTGIATLLQDYREITSGIIVFYQNLSMELFDQHGIFKNREIVRASESSYGAPKRDRLPIFISNEEDLPE